MKCKSNKYNSPIDPGLRWIGAVFGRLESKRIATYAQAGSSSRLNDSTLALQTPVRRRKSWSERYRIILSRR